MVTLGAGGGLYIFHTMETSEEQRRKGLERIIEQRLTPLYVSVHATDVEARTELLGIKRRIDVMETLHHLTAHGIEVHAPLGICAVAQ